MRQRTFEQALQELRRISDMREILDYPRGPTEYDTDRGGMAEENARNKAQLFEQTMPSISYVNLLRQVNRLHRKDPRVSGLHLDFLELLAEQETYPYGSGGRPASYSTEPKAKAEKTPDPRRRYVMVEGSGKPVRMKAIHSGGQTGADQAGLAAGVTLGLRTGGWVPKGWRTDTGPAPWLGKDLGLREHSSSSYPPRTALNVQETDGTLVFGKTSSPGSKLTMRKAREMGKPFFVVEWRGGAVPSDQVNAFRQWLILNQIQVLNVAGNRESSNPGITQAVHDFIVAAVR